MAHLRRISGDGLLPTLLFSFPFPLPVVFGVLVPTLREYDALGLLSFLLYQVVSLSSFCSDQIKTKKKQMFFYVACLVFLVSMFCLRSFAQKYRMPLSRLVSLFVPLIVLLSFLVCFLFVPTRTKIIATNLRVKVTNAAWTYMKMISTFNRSVCKFICQLIGHELVAQEFVCREMS